MAKNKNSYGVYKIERDSFTLKKGGFENSYACEKWVRNQVKIADADEKMDGEFAIMSMRRKFSLQTKTTVSVKLVDVVVAEPSMSKRVS